MADEGKVLQADRATLDAYQLYDRSVDVVSAFHWLFTETGEMPGVVRHFERYPSIQVNLPDGQRTLTPDFTVLFEDGTGWVAEIANIALHENSIEKLCSQLLNYSRIAELPGPDGSPVQVTAVDVVFLSPMKTAADAAKRVFEERLSDEAHPYKPDKKPILMQFAQQPDEYVFQPWPDSTLNGAFTPHGDSKFTSMQFTSLTIKPGNFANNKVRFAFCNDPVPPLYLATRLVVSVFPVIQPELGKSFEVTVDELVRALKWQYGHGRASDVGKALALLKAAGLASSKDGRMWRISSGSGKLGREDVHVSIATRVAKAAVPRPKKRRTGAVTAEPLFEDAEQLEELLRAQDDRESAEAH